MMLEILTPEKSVFKGEVSSIQLPGSNGLLGVLNRHAPLVTGVEPGPLKLVEKDKTTYLFISGGFLEVQNNYAVLLADSVEKPTEMDIVRVNEALKRAHGRLGERKTNKKSVDFPRAERAKKRAVERKKFYNQHKDA